jgi:hypothetical protein
MRMWSQCACHMVTRTVLRLLRGMKSLRLSALRCCRACSWEATHGQVCRSCRRWQALGSERYPLFTRDLRLFNGYNELTYILTTLSTFQTLGQMYSPYLRWTYTTCPRTMPPVNSSLNQKVTLP